MQGILATLERARLITRTPHPQHGRVLESTLTEHGATLLEEARSRVEKVERLLVAATDGLSGEFARLLAQVASHLTN
jgi:DNA-binding MarR family transcriptional regulator